MLSNTATSTAATTVSIATNITITTTCNTPTTTTVNTATTKAKGLKVKILKNIEGEVELNQNTLCACRLSKGRVSNILGTAWSTKLKLTGFVAGDAEITKRQYLHAATTTSITVIATIITSASTNISTKPKGIKVKISGDFETMFN